MTKPLHSITAALLILAAQFCYAQKPVISYTTPQTYEVGTPITPLAPTNTGGAVLVPGVVTLSSGFNNPTSVAVDAAGNIYFTANGVNSVVKIPAGGGSAIILGSGFNQPTGITVDATGNAYVADFGNNAIKKIPAGGGAIVTITSGSISPYGIVLDGSGNLFFSDWSTNTIKKVSSAGGTPVIYASGFNTPTGVAVDAAGTVYVTDRGNNLIKKILVGGNIVNVASGNGNPNGVAVDAAGNVYLADTNVSSIIKIPAGGGSQASLGSGFSTPAGVAVSASGDIIYVDDSGNNAIKKITFGGYAINQPLPAGLAFDNGTGIISGTPTAVSPVTSYTVTATNSAGSASFTIKISVKLPAKPIISYSGPRTYVVGTAITTLSPGSTGGDVPFGGYSINPALPEGLMFDINTGAISGVPASARAVTDYTITATNPGGSGTTVLKMTIVLPAKPNISYSSPQNYIAQVSTAPLSPVNTGGSIPAGGYAITPTLPAGLSFDINTGSIAGTPTITSLPANYMVAATNPGGTGSYTLKLAVSAPAKPIISYDADQVYTTNVAIAPVLPKNSGGVIPDQTTTMWRLPVQAATNLTIDASGNIYVINNVLNTGNKTVEKISAGTTTSIAVAELSQDFSLPNSIAVDPAGNIYIGDGVQEVVKKIPAGGGTPVLVGSGYTTLNGIAADNQGNIYISDFNGPLKKISAAGQTTTLAVSGISNPSGIAVDVHGNIYITDNGSIKKITPNSTSATILATGLGGSTGIAIDALGDIYIIGQQNNRVTKVLASGGVTGFVGDGLLYSPSGIAVDATGNLYIADTYQAVKIINSGGYSITPALPEGLNFNYITGSISGTPIKPSPATNYTITAANAGGYGSTVLNITVDQYPLPVISYQSPQVYTVNKAVNPPLTPQASGVAAEGAYFVTTAASGLNNLRGVTVDAAGNMYVAQLETNVVKKIPADGSDPVIIASGFNGPNGLAVDAAGNVYVTDNGNNAIKKIPVGGGAVVTVASGLNSPYGLALDPTGQFLYVTNKGNGLIQKIPVGGGAAVTIGPAFNIPTGIALDRAGNIYISDAGANQVFKIAAGSNTATVLSNGLGYPNGVAADGAGNVYYVDINSSSIRKVPFDGGPVVEIGAGLSTPVGFAIDAKNVIYVSDFYHNAITRLTPSGGFYINPDLPVGLSFNTITGVISGTPTVVSPSRDYLVTAYNQGGGTSVTVNIKISTGADLKSLALSSGELSPKFTPGVTIYAATLSNANATIKLTPATDDPAVTVKINGTSVTSGSASPPIALTVGPNVITTVVTAVDGVTTKTYTVTVTRAAANLSTNAGLSGIKLTPNTPLTTVTGPGNANYKTLVPNSESSLTLTLTASEAHATIKVNGTIVASGAASQPIPLNVGDNVINVGVTAQDGATIKSYIITATRAGSSIATLSNLALNIGVLSPGFATATVAYTTVVPNSASSIKITPTATEANATIKVNGATAASGVASASLPLAVGANTITTIVTAQDGSATKTYTVTVTRAAAGLSTNAGLSGIKLTPNTPLTTVTGPANVNYATPVPNSESSLMVTLTVSESHATIKINGTTVASGAASQPIPLSVGDNIINAVVTAQDGATIKSYIITATRAGSSIATLSNLVLNTGVLNPVFAPATTGYTAIVPNATSSIKITPTVTEANATITVNGVTVASGVASANIALAAGANTIATTVTAQDGTTTKTYTLTVTRAAAGLSTNASISGIKLTPNTALTTVTGPGNANYKTLVPNSESSLTVTTTASEAHATIKVNGTSVTSGVASQPVPLSLGDNIINIVVTAQDGATIKSYIITATRAGAAVATLSNLALSAGVLSPVFTTATTAYTSVVPNATSSIKITPTVTDANATVKVNGATVASGAASASLSLAVGANAITTIVTAQDGTTTKTYKVTVTRAAANLSTNASLSAIKLNPNTPLTSVTGPGNGNYTTPVPFGESSLTVTLTASETHATIKVNGKMIASGAASQPIPLKVGANVINIAVTAQDGATTKTFIITATRAAGSLVAQYVDPADNLKADGIFVHQGVSPNGDGDNDVLTIDGIAAYPDNNVAIMSRSGQLVFEAKGYNNTSIIFDGHSNKNGRLQQAGTYFYSLDYKDGNETKHKTGFILLKY